MTQPVPPDPPVLLDADVFEGIAFLRGVLGAD